MRPISNIIIELIAISISAVILLPIIEFAMTGEFLKQRQGTYQMYLGTVLLVSMLHIVYEYTGLNEKWCRMTYK